MSFLLKVKRYILQETFMWVGSEWNSLEFDLSLFTMERVVRKFFCKKLWASPFQEGAKFKKVVVTLVFFKCIPIFLRNSLIMMYSIQEKVNYAAGLLSNYKQSYLPSILGLSKGIIWSIKGIVWKKTCFSETKPQRIRYHNVAVKTP